MTQPDIPSIRNMIEIAQSNDTLTMCKCVSEHIQKRAKWKQIPGFVPDQDILADHIIAYNSRGIDDGKYHADYVHAPEDPGTIGSYEEYEDEDTHFTVPGAYTPMLNLSRRNSGKIKGSNGFIDNQLVRGNLWNDKDNLRGFTARVNPKTHRIFNNVDDWINFVKERPVYRQYDGRGATEGDWAFPDWKGHADNGVHSVEWTRAFFDDLNKKEIGKPKPAIKKLLDARVGMHNAMGGEPQIAVLHPDAIRSTEPYKWADHADTNSKEYRRINNIYNSPDEDDEYEENEEDDL